MNVQEKLLNVQMDLKAPKSQYNSFGKYNYRNCEDILEVAKPLCKKNGALLTVSDTLIFLGDRFYIQATARFTDADKPEDFIEVNGYAREEESKKGMDGSQVTGASSSYARKYALNGLFCIDDTKDSDTTNNGMPDKKPKQYEDFSDQCLCEKCGKPLADYLFGGKKVTVSNHIALSKMKYDGHIYCIECINKLKAQAS